MATDAASARQDHVRAVTITSGAALAGVFAAVLSGVITQGVPASEAASDINAISILLIAILVQLPLYRIMGYEEFGGGKDVLYVAFMTFALWFITFGIVLTTGVTFL
ncbi:MAG: hypothetical protein ACLFMX_07635 [Halobacteriales archaeon]